MKNKIDSIVIHCSATKEGKDFRAADIDRMHRDRGFDCIGYHYVIDLDGTVELGRPLSMVGAHCNAKDSFGKSYNRHSVGICYIGGLDKKGGPSDTRTDGQKEAMRELVNSICREYPVREILGHRDTSPDLNKNGKADKNEWVKSCPCFEVRDEFSSFLEPVIVRP